MKSFNRYIFLLIAGCCMVLLPLSAKAQNTYSYSTINYDADTNTVSAYAETATDYNTQVYYGSKNAQSMVRDANGNLLATKASNTGVLSIDVSGNNSSSYTITSGHYLLASYQVYNSYSPCGNHQFYYYGYNDYYNYRNFFGTPSTPSVFGLYLFFGPGPQCYQSSPDDILGQTVSTVDVTAQPDVQYTTASIPGAQGSFQSGPGYQYADLNATASQCSPYATIALTVNYVFNYNVQQILGVTAKGFGSTSVSEWNVNSITHTENLSASPQTGQAVISVNNKNGGLTGTTYNKVQVTVKGKYSSGYTFSTLGSVHLNCP
jgi:hypothetical protein